MSHENPGSARGPDGVSTSRHYLQVLWRRKWVVLVPLVTIPLAVYIASVRQDALYQVSADVLVNRQEVATTSLIGQTPALDDAGRTMDTQARLARVPLVAERALAAAGLPGAAPRTLLDHSSVYPLGDFLRFQVSGDDPGPAARLANAYAHAFVRYRRELDTIGFEATLRQVRRQIGQLEAAGNVRSPLYLRLADREQQLEALRALRTSNVSVVETATGGDAEQVAPRPKRNTAVGLLAAGVVGLILVVLWETLSTRPRSTLEFEELLDLPFLGRVPAPEAETTSPVRGAAADAIHGLRTNLELANASLAARTIMVTSPHEGEGKTGVLLQLGLALARSGRRVVLVDLDLRRSTLTGLTGLSGRPGMSDLVLGQASVDDILVPLPQSAGVDDERIDRLGASESSVEVLGSGRTAVSPPELASAAAVAEVLTDLQQRADIVLVDVPPVLDVPDAAAVALRVDGLLLVVSSRTARGPVLADVRRAIESWPLVKIGFALTERTADRPSTGRLRSAKQPTRTQVVESEPLG